MTDDYTAWMKGRVMAGFRDSSADYSHSQHPLARVLGSLHWLRKTQEKAN